MQTLLASLALGGLALAQPAHATGEGWIDDFDRAVELAKKEGKDLLVDFTGSDWCVWCHRLDGEVFAHDAFLEPIKKDYVLVMLDFPRDPKVKAKVPDAERNAEVQEKYKVQGFPTVLLMTADGDVYGQTGYQPGGPEKYVEHLADLRKARAVIPFVKKWESAEGDRSALYSEAIELLSGLDYGNVMAQRLAAPVRAAMESDPTNESGLRARAAKALLASGVGGADAIAVARELDPKNEKGLLEWAVRNEVEAVKDPSGVEAAVEKIEAFEALGKVHDEDAVQIIWVYAAFWNHQIVKDADKAKHYARKVMAHGTDNPQIEQMMDSILGE